MKRAITVLFAALLLASAGGVGGPATATAAEILGPSGPPIRLEIQEGRLIRLDRPAATVFIANSDVADVQVQTPRLIYIFGRSTGETTLYAVDENDEVLLNRTVKISHNLGQLQDSLENFVPQGDHVVVRSLNNQIVLDGHVASAGAAEDVRRIAASYVEDEAQIINNIDVTGSQQVNLRVRIVEMARSTSQRLGINWDVVTNTGNFVFGLSTGIPTTAAGLPFFPVGALASAANTLVSRPNGNDSLVTNFNNGTVEVNNLIDALDTEGLIRTLAEPNLSALSGETASFLAGGEFPIPVPQEDGVVTIIFRQFGVSLAFTPTVMDNNRINLRVSPEVSQLSNAGAITLQTIAVPALTISRADTTVEIGSGQTLAIAGLIQNRSNYNLRETPWLADIPILGELFRSHNFQQDETELIILVTPYLVHPINRSQIVQRPAPDFVASTAPESAGHAAIDGAMVTSGRTAAPATAPVAPGPAYGAPAALQGPSGFTLE